MAVAALVALVLTIGGVVGFRYRDVIGAHLTHRIGGPPQTWEVVPFPPDAQPAFRVALVGDVGDSGSHEHQVGERDRAADQRDDRYDVLMLLGDNVYPSGDPDRIEATVYEPFNGVLESGTELFAILGNHDVAGGLGDVQLDALGMPSRWYSVRRGDMLGIALDSNDPTNPEQLAWLEETLATTDATWKLVGLHHPPYSSGFHGSNDDARRVFSPIFEKYGVQVVFSGHEHDYQRTNPINGVTYIVTGAGSRTRRTGTEDFTAVAYSTHHYVDMNIFDDHIVLRAIDQDGEQFDEAIIPKTLATARTRLG